MLFFYRVTWAMVVSAMLTTSGFAAGYRDLEQRINSLEQRLVRMERQNQALIEMLQQQEALRKEVQLLRGDGEQSLHAIDVIKKRQRELFLDIDRRLQQLEETSSAKGRGGSVPLAVDSGGDEPPPSKGVDVAAVKEPEVREAASHSTDSASEREAYKKAFNMLKERRYAESVDAFKAFLNQYPQSVYAGNAQYWLAEANYVSGDYNNALLEFKKVIDNYPVSPKVPDATLKMGFTHYEMAQWDQARQALASLRQKYPNSTVARLAEERLQRMKSEGH